MKFITHILVGLLLLCLPLELLAAPTSVMWSGVGFTGDWENRQRYYPTTSSFFNHSGSEIEQWARDRIVKSKEYPFAIRLDQVDERAIDQVGLAVTISRESVMHEKIIVGGAVEFLENYSLSGSAIFFDLKSKKLIASAPLITRYSRVYKSVPSETERHAIFKSMLSDNELGLNFFDEMSKKLSKVQLTSLPSQYIQIKEFNIDPTVHPDVVTSPDIDLFTSYLSTFFENQLLGESGISLIPNSVGHAIGNKIATRLPSGDMTITLPEPGYTLDLRVHKLIYQNKPNKLTDSLCWGGVLSLDVNKHLFGEEKMATIGVKDVNCATVDKGVTLENFSEYQKLLMGLLDGLAHQFESIDKKWLKEKAMDRKQAKKDIEGISAEFKAAML